MIEAAIIAKHVSMDEYLRLADASAEKLEYDDGEIVAMAGTTPTHVRISGNLARLFHAADVMRAEGGRRLVRARQCINSPSVRKAPPYPHSNAVVFGIELGGVRRC